MITYLKGDATRPIGDGPKYIAHICNDQGGWGAGFVLAISRRWKEPEKQYRAWSREEGFQLGLNQYVQVIPHGFKSEQVTVVNMVAQHSYGEDGKPPIRYDALSICLEDLAHHIVLSGGTIHMPRIGCGLAGGSWPEVEALINEHMPDIPVFVYDL